MFCRALYGRVRAKISGLPPGLPVRMSTQVHPWPTLIAFLHFKTVKVYNAELKMVHDEHCA